MRNYDYKKLYRGLLQPDIVNLISQIHEYKGEQSFFVEMKSEILTRMVEIARIQSMEASNKMEGIYTSEEMLKEIVQDKVKPATSSEKEMVGYRNVLAAIYENYGYMPLRPLVLQQIHRDLHKFSSGGGGMFRRADRAAAKEAMGGHTAAVLSSVTAQEVEAHVEAICMAFEEACREPDCDPLILIPVFVLDFLCIRPFDVGNNRMSRLLMLLLLYRAGYMVGRYVSLERLMEQSRETYYEMLRQSQAGWHEAENRYAPFVRYLLGILLASYRDFSQCVQLLTASGLSKPERVREIVRGTLGKITRAQIMARCPDISQVTVERALNEMQKRNEVIKIGGGRYTAYAWNWEQG